jgi:hypothetical protein
MCLVLLVKVRCDASRALRHGLIENLIKTTTILRVAVQGDAREHLTTTKVRIGALYAVFQVLGKVQYKSAEAFVVNPSVIGPKESPTYSSTILSCSFSVT